MRTLPELEPLEVTLTRTLLFLEEVNPTWAGPGPGEAEAILLDVQTRRHLQQVLGFGLCKDRCTCDSLTEEHHDLPADTPCTGSWTGCEGCNENAITYCEGMMEYNICRLCHWEGRCLDDTIDACEYPCEVYPHSPHHD